MQFIFMVTSIYQLALYKLSIREITIYLNRAVKLYRKLAIMMKDMKFFAVKMYKFDDTHLQELIKSQSSMDKKLFYMDLSDMVWESYFLDSLLEVRRHILNEPDDRTMSNQKYKK